MWKFNDEKIIFDKFTGFLTSPILDDCTYGMIVNSAYFVKSPFVYHFNTLQAEDVLKLMKCFSYI